LQIWGNANKLEIKPKKIRTFADPLKINVPKVNLDIIYNDCPVANIENSRYLDAILDNILNYQIGSYYEQTTIPFPSSTLLQLYYSLFILTFYLGSSCGAVLIHPL